MKKPKLVIWGAAGQAMVVADIVRQEGRFELAGFLDDLNPENHGRSIGGTPVLGGREQLPNLQKMDIRHLILGFGKNTARLRLAKELEAMGFQLASAVHPKASVAPDVVIRAGTVVKAGASIDPDTRIGKNVIVGACVTLAHGCRIGDGVLLSGGTDLAGRVAVGDGSWLGTGSSIIHDLKVGAFCLIGAGAVLTQDVPDNSVAYGVPAKIVRTIKAGEL